jgi:hypothetical protein
MLRRALAIVLIASMLIAWKLGVWVLKFSLL